ncbi:hypothetical protein sce4560 [Sorangium cellulosum So ce56]|uniref:Uncharacterized protein n=1 Tax=Sorangium cellulosum (strain So ce56) TaxID=448385 RepID=A9F962_SORC5|nr:hypothetical protein sce4560 [Sorangium cellulosum So ce56]
MSRGVRRAGEGVGAAAGVLETLRGCGDGRLADGFGALLEVGPRLGGQRALCLFEEGSVALGALDLAEGCAEIAEQKGGGEERPAILQAGEEPQLKLQCDCLTKASVYPPAYVQRALCEDQRLVRSADSRGCACEVAVNSLLANLIPDLAMAGEHLQEALKGFPGLAGRERQETEALKAVGLPEAIANLAKDGQSEGVGGASGIQVVDAHVEVAEALQAVGLPEAIANLAKDGQSEGVGGASGIQVIDAHVEVAEALQAGGLAKAILGASRDLQAMLVCLP